jgi:sialate O-acetylesterase
VEAWILSVLRRLQFSSDPGETSGDRAFPFYYCQLANIADKPREPESSEAWCVVANQMRLAMDKESTGMAVLNDIGGPDDIHPHNKIDAGKRLWLWALAKTYGKEEWKGH